jgi:hypothetical protein
LGSDNEDKFSKNQRRKLRRYGKVPNQSPVYKRRLEGENHELAEFISSLVRRPAEEDHSLDELELHEMETERKRNHIVKGSFETGKHR